MIDFELMRRKLSRLNTCLEKIEPIRLKTLPEYEADDYLHFSTERLIQLIVERASEINNHVVVETNKKPPEDYRSSFARAAESELITAQYHCP